MANYKLVIEINTSSAKEASQIAREIGFEVAGGSTDGVENDGPNGEQWEYHLYETGR